MARGALSLFAAGLLSASGLTAQEPRYRDGPLPMRTTGAYDAARNRLVLLGQQGDIREWDGQRWLHRPHAFSQFTAGRLAWHGGSRRIVAFGLDDARAAGTWDWDGATWRRLNPSTMPPARSTHAMAYDSLRDRVVVFGGGGPFTAAFADTWEWDGTNWIARTPLVSPPGRSSAAMAFDPVRGVCVLFGGFIGFNVVDDHWEWDGTNWTQRSLSPRPPPREEHAMAYDFVRLRTVLVGGSATPFALGDQWEYDGSAWSQVLVTPSAATTRWLHTLHQIGGEVHVVGGLEGNTPARSMWSWNGSRWVVRAPLPAMPAGRSDAAIARDPTTGGVLLFGGGSYQGMPTDTWRWDGFAWSQVATAGPPARRLATAWTGPAEVFLFGGQPQTTGTLNYLGDLWRWNGVTWSALTTASGPSPREASSAAAFDSARGRAVLFGGRQGFVLGDTWTFDGANWQQHNPATPPPPREKHALANDPLRGRVVMFGGSDPVQMPLNDTWEWDGAQWTQVVTARRPTARAPAAMDFDWGRLRIVLVQSDTLSGTPPGLWSYDGNDWTPLGSSQPFQLYSPVSVVGGPARRGVLLLDGNSVVELPSAPDRVQAYGSACGPPPYVSARAWPRLGGRDFGIDIGFAPSNAPLLLVAATQPASLPVGPCTLLVAPGQAALFALANYAGFVSIDMAIPEAPILLRGDLFTQAAALEPAVPAGFVMSAGLRITVGG